MSKKIVSILGSGIGGIAIAIRLAKAGHQVNVFEKNDYAGGKLSELYLGEFRFDKGPSLLTMPNLIDELTELSGSKNKFEYQKIDTITHYFYEDGTRINASSNLKIFTKEINEKLGEEEEVLINYFERSKFYYDTTADLFLNQSLSQIKNFLNFKTLKGMLRSHRLGLFSTMHQKNRAAFKNEKTVQLFNRYATYNGSSPYQAPALLNIISHLEFGLGAFIPKNGMYQITEHLVAIANGLGVVFNFNKPIDEILITNNKAIGIRSNDATYKSDLVISDIDIHTVYTKLLPTHLSPKKQLQQQKSSSAYVFYWGINKIFLELGLHNILFSNNYKEEFELLFNAQQPSNDPTIYINITSKYCKNDAPANCENWFVMVNVPHNKNPSIHYAAALRKNIVSKINRILKTDIEKYILEESKLDPIDIENQTSSLGGSLYGNSSNSRFSAFKRHSNYSSKIKNLYFVGGSVHPGGGIPLCLLSAKIASKLIEERNCK
jgi:phytoene desaturase